MKVRTFLAVTFGFSLVLPIVAGVDEGIQAMQRVDYAAAYEEFLPLAEAGDTQAMITIALWYHQGTGFAQDYGKAMDWYLKAFKTGNGDAYNNIGVMYRDGLGVEADRSISYALFLLTHLRSLGSEATQYRANGNLRREIESTSDDERALGLCITERYLEAFVEARGMLEQPHKQHLPSRRNPRIRDNKQLWLASELERMDFECPAPWDGKRH